jgi:hypothetical protein
VIGKTVGCWKSTGRKKSVVGCASDPLLKRVDGRGKRVPAVRAMLRKKELAFLKYISSIELSPLFLRELKKTVAASKKKKVLAATTPSNTSAPALHGPAEMAVKVGPPPTLRSSK